MPQGAPGGVDQGRATVIISPMASRIRTASAREQVRRGIVDALAVRGLRDVSVVEAGTTVGIQDAALTARTDGSSLVVLAGGDGTIRDAAGVLAGSGIPLGLVPCGTGNLYALSLGLPRELPRAYAVIAGGSARDADIGMVVLEPEDIAANGGVDGDADPADGGVDNDADPQAGVVPHAVPFIVACGTGFDARLIGAASPSLKARFGVAAYFLAAASVLDHLTARPTVLTIDGERTELEASVVLIANTGAAIPGRWQPRLPIDPHDGQLHVFVLPRSGVVHGIRGALELMFAQAAGHSPSGASLRLVGQRVRVEVEPDQPTEIDGDLTPVGDIEAWVRPGALSVLLPG
jgi:diacylglycerol kinase (ATP)